MSLTSLDGIRRSKASLEAFIGSRTAAHFGPSSTPETRPFDPRISIVIPTLNEASNLPFVFSTIASLDAEVIVVDGRSSDDTVRVAKALREGVVVVHEIRRGKGAALQAGFAAATGDIIVMLDSDGSADGREIPAFVDALRQGADFAKGSRFISGGGSADITLIRQTGNSFLSKLVSTTFGAQFTDLCYGYNAFWRDCLPYLNVDCDGFEVETLLNIRAVRSGLRIAEVPSYESNRIHGVSNLNALRDGLRVLRTIILEVWKQRDLGAVKQPARAAAPERSALSA
jgi:glycosyltransferase involved in cell wall biosynthesis